MFAKPMAVPFGICEHPLTHIGNIPVNIVELKLASENGLQRLAPKTSRSQVNFDAVHGYLLIYRLLQRTPI